MKSGTITGNTATSNSNGNGGGVFVGNGATFNLSGSPTITGNTGSNVYLTENIKINVTDKLNNTTPIGVTMASPGVFTDGLSGKGGVANFESDDPNYGVRLNDANDKTFTMPAYPVTVNATFAQKIEPPTASTGLVYNGSARTGVAAGTGYTLTGNIGTDAGDYTATATLESGYIWNDVTTDAKQIPWSIGRKAVTVTAKDATKTYDGSALTENGFTATALETGDTHTFTVAMTAGSTITNAGTQSNVIATVDGVAVTTGTATEVGNYKVTTVNGTLTVEQKSITGATVTLSEKELTYNGAERSVTVTGVKLDDVTLTAGDYEVSGDTKGTNEGTYKVTVTGKDNYKDTASETWKITPKAMNVSVPDVTKNYDGNGYGIAVKVNDPASGSTIKYGTSAGTCTLTESPKQTDAGTLIVYYQVTAANYVTATGSAKVTINKAPITPTVSLANWTYGKTANAPGVSGNAGGGAVTYAYSDKKDGTYGATQPTTAGTW